jgi:hypothetical protein
MNSWEMKYIQFIIEEGNEIEKKQILLFHKNMIICYTTMQLKFFNGSDEGGMKMKVVWFICVNFSILGHIEIHHFNPMKSFFR